MFGVLEPQPGRSVRLPSVTETKPFVFNLSFLGLNEYPFNMPAMKYFRNMKCFFPY